MKVAILGPGALGCLFAWLLRRGGEDPWLVDHRPERVELLRRQGLRVHTLQGTEEVTPVRASWRPREVGTVDLLLVAVKAYDTVRALRRVRALVGPETTVLSLQNGWGNLERMQRALGNRGRPALGVTAQGATLLGAGHVRHAGQGQTVVGRDAAPAASLLRRCGVPVEVVEDVRPAVWGKLAVNAGINPLSAISGLPNGQLAELPPLRRLVLRAAAEAEAVARAAGVQPPWPAGERALAVCRATAQNLSSMLQDVLRGRRTEVDFINGAVVRLGRRLGVPAPLNAVLWRLVRLLETLRNSSPLNS